MIIGTWRYDGDGRSLGPADPAAGPPDPDDGFVWVTVSRLDDADVEALREAFGLTAIPTTGHRRQRPKLAITDNTVAFMARAAHYDDDDEEVDLSEIVLWAGPGFAITAYREDAPTAEQLRDAVERAPSLLAHGPAAVLLAALDLAVDEYMPAARGVDTDIDEVEDTVFSSARDSSSERIYKLKGEVLDFHRAARQLLDPLDQLGHGRSKLVDEELAHHFLGLHERVRHVADLLTGQRELLTSVLEAHLAQLSIRQNEDMRRISAWAAIAAIPTLITGLYGMNFEHMPELSWPFGYPLALGVMALLCGALYVAFRRSGWL